MGEGGCTNCGSKGGCDDRKGGMFAAIQAALERLYPTRAWGNRDDAGGFGFGAGVRAVDLAELIKRRLGTWTLAVDGNADEYCDYVYVLALGREPPLLAAQQGLVAPADVWADSPDDAAVEITELYLRVAVSTVAPFVAVQQLTLSGTRAGDDLIITEDLRSGVFDAVLLARFRKLVAALQSEGLDHLDFGDLTVPPDGFDGAPYRAVYGQEPGIANYLFYPQPCSSITTSLLSFETIAFRA